MSANQLHLTPVHSILQMRTSLEHLDNYVPDEESIDDEENRNEKEGTNEMELSGNYEQVGYKKRVQPSNKSEYDSYKQLKQQEILDEWVNLNVCVDENEIDKLYSKIGEDVPVKGDGKSYYQSLNYAQAVQTTQLHSVLPTNRQSIVQEPLPVYSLDFLKEHPIDEQVKRILFTSHIVSFETVKDLTSASISNDLKLIETLNNFSILVRGNFCLLSEFIYQDRKYQALRDIVIIHLNEFGCVSKSQLEKKLLTASSIVQEILETITELNRKKRRWESKVPDDIQFIRQFPEIVELHNEKLYSLKSTVSDIYNIVGEPECEIIGPINLGEN